MQQDIYIFGKSATGKTTRMMLEAMSKLETHRFYQEPIKAAVDTGRPTNDVHLRWVASTMLTFLEHIRTIRKLPGSKKIICDNSALQAFWYLSRDKGSAVWEDYHNVYEFHVAELRGSCEQGAAKLFVQEGSCEEFAIENGFTNFPLFKPYRLT